MFKVNNNNTRTIPQKFTKLLQKTQELTIVSISLIPLCTTVNDFNGVLIVDFEQVFSRGAILKTFYKRKR